MKIDNKVKEDYKIFTCFDTEQAKQYVDTMGYFTDDISDFNNFLDDCYYDRLDGVDDNSSRPFFNKYLSKYFTFFLPEEFVKQKEKKYIPCTLDNFGLNIGDLIKFRKKDDHTFEIETMYMGHMKTYGTVKVLLGQCYYSFDELFNKYEWFDRDSNTWEVFGVKE